MAQSKIYTEEPYCSLSAEAKVLYGYLLSEQKKNPKGCVFCSQKDAASILKCAEGTARRAFKSLEALNLIDRASAKGMRTQIFVRDIEEESNDQEYHGQDTQVKEAPMADVMPKKERSQIDESLKLLNSSNRTLATILTALQKLEHDQDAPDFPEKHYYIGTIQQQLYDEIAAEAIIARNVEDYDLVYRNCNLIYGASGTGKTTFTKYVAYKLDLPYVYLSLSELMDSCPEKAARTLRDTFRPHQKTACVLMLDDIDYIGFASRNNIVSDGTLKQMTNTLVKCLNAVTPCQTVIAAANRIDGLDKELLGKFRNKIEFTPYGPDEELQMIQNFVKDIEFMKVDADLRNYAKKGHSQAETVDYLADKVGNLLREILPSFQK